MPTPPWTMPRDARTVDGTVVPAPRLEVGPRWVVPSGCSSTLASQTRPELRRLDPDPGREGRVSGRL